MERSARTMRRGLRRKEEYYPVWKRWGVMRAEAARVECGVLARMAPAWLAHRAASRGWHSVDCDKYGTRADAGRFVRGTGTNCGEKPLVLVFEDLHWADASDAAADCRRWRGGALWRS